ncbi:T9SS type A sorting domain-containing protein [bacterium]|nr:T9SS type A sorting domain-containing protein [bacterium]
MKRGIFGAIILANLCFPATPIYVSIVSHSFTDAFEDNIEAIQEYVDSGIIRWVTLQQAVEIWRTEYDSVPNLFWFDTTTGIVNNKSSSEKKIAIDVFPNPFNSQCEIRIPKNLSGLCAVQIFDNHGRMIFQKDLCESQCDKLLWRPQGFLSAGVYLVRAIKTNGDCIERKIVYIK